MINIKPILMNHYERYPLMQIEDFIKLIYQNTFGPIHFTGNPNLKQIESYLVEELQFFIPYLDTPQVEDIGDGYQRISLSMILNKEITIEELALQFLKSMEASRILDNTTLSLFNDRIIQLMNLIEDHQIKLDLDQSKAFIQEYLSQGIRAISHSKTYRTHYHPHYRVIKRNPL